MVLDVEGDDVADLVAEGFDFGFGFWGEGYGGEDGQGAGCEFDWVSVSMI